MIEDVTVDRNGNVIPKLYSKAQANRDLRQMLNIGGRGEPEANNTAKLSDAELIQQIAEQAKELGIVIDLNYRFAQLQSTDSEPPTEANDGQVIDETAQPVADAQLIEEERRAAEAAREMKISAQPSSSKRRSLVGARKKAR